ncbi:MAG: TetR/AcrR family transcriptional regulator [Clostridiales bacterium]|jgi:AcrR family transcriptional regulator|nr:TetR/AcrR family transcriptional regulator [Clostridiales bacterium]
MTKEAKDTKEQAILNMAGKMFLAADYEKIKMSDLAKEVGISNGLLYVYFKTKETLFMRLLCREYDKRLDYLTGIAKKTDFKSFADVKRLFITELELLVKSNPLYIGLEAMRPAILEKNTDLEMLFDIKKNLFKRAVELSAIISNNGVIFERQIIEIFFMESAIIIGCRLNSGLPAGVAEIVDRIGMKEFHRDFETDVLNAFSCYLDGFEAKLSC